MMWQYILIGALAWQTVTTVVLIATDENETATIWAGIGIIGAIIAGIFAVVRNIIRWVDSRRYVSLMINAVNGRLYYCPSEHSLVDKIMEYNKSYKWANKIIYKYNPSDGWRKDDCIFGGVNLRYTPIKVAKAEGAIPVDKITIKAAKEA